MRGVSNPPNPFHSAHLEWDGPAPDVELQVFEDHARTILSRNDSPDLGFTWSVRRPGEGRQLGLFE